MVSNGGGVQRLTAGETVPDEPADLWTFRQSSPTAGPVGRNGLLKFPAVCGGFGGPFGRRPFGPGASAPLDRFLSEMESSSRKLRAGRKDRANNYPND